MIVCPECGRECKSKAGLASHRRSHRDETGPGPVAEAVAADLESVEGPAALRATALKLGQVVDQTTSSRYLPRLVSELRQVLGALDVTGERTAEQADRIDEIAAARARRQGEGPAS